jgi:hypothetical protein
MGPSPSIARGETNAMKPSELIRSLMLGNRAQAISDPARRRFARNIFAISGGNKLFVASYTRQMYETLSGAEIPFPHFMTYFVSSVGFIGGRLLIIGWLPLDLDPAAACFPYGDRSNVCARRFNHCLFKNGSYPPDSGRLLSRPRQFFPPSFPR